MASVSFGRVPVYLFVEHFLFGTVRCLSSIFPAPALASAISPRSLGFPYSKLVFRNQGDDQLLTPLLVKQGRRDAYEGLNCPESVTELVAWQGPNLGLTPGSVVFTPVFVIHKCLLSELMSSLKVGRAFPTLCEISIVPPVKSSTEQSINARIHLLQQTPSASLVSAQVRPSITLPLDYCHGHQYSGFLLLFSVLLTVARSRIERQRFHHLLPNAIG